MTGEPDSVEEVDLYCQHPFGTHTLRFVRTADNNVMLFVQKELVAVLKIEDQQRLMQWFVRKVAESL